MKKRKTLISMLALVFTLIAVIGFAAITANLSIGGTVAVNPNTEGFSVVFEAGEGYTLDNAKTTATVTVDNTKLKEVGDSCQVTLTIKNASEDKYNATITSVNATSVTPTPSGQGNPSASDITIATDFTSPTTIAQDSSDTVTITFTLNKAQTESATFTFSISFVATAVAA